MRRGANPGTEVCSEGSSLVCNERTVLDTSFRSSSSKVATTDSPGPSCHLLQPFFYSRASAVQVGSAQVSGSAKKSALQATGSSQSLGMLKAVIAS